MFGNGSGVVQFSSGSGEIPFAGLQPAGDATKSRKAKERVLVVDDEKMVADTTSEIFCGAGFDVKSAYDGWTALEIATRFRPDYLLTDVLMPRMNGVELAIAVTKLLPDVRIVLFSGQAGISEIVHDGHKRGYDFELVAKPIHPMKLLEYFRNQRYE
jgi:CheY-like chemotaxis protein